MDAAAQQALSAPPLIGSWTVQRRLGAGAMGEVFLAERGNQRAALKLVAKRYAGDDAFTQRFQREIALLSKFDHCNVARALDGGEHEGRPWLAMEFVDGPDLENLLDKHGPFFETDVLQLAIQVARGLEHIHQQAELIHRDVKPANILVARAPGGDPHRLLNPGDITKLIDFGLAKPIEQEEGNGLTMTGMIMGTPNYIAPEQVACERNLTLHVDMYALGATIFHLLTGHVPFEAGSAAAVMAAHLNNPVPDPGQQVPAISQATRRLVMTTLAKRPTDRFTDWRAFIIACEKAVAALGAASAAEGGSTNRFLRKPMTRPTTSVVTRPAALGSSSGSRSTPKPVVALGGHALEPRPGTAAAVAASLGVGGPANGSDALRAAVTSRIIKVQTSSVHRKGGTKRRAGGVATSAVSKWSGRLETSGTTGGSVLPWIVLIAAGLLAIGAVTWAVTLR
jgi:serine/threonine protein kinase